LRVGSFREATAEVGALEVGGAVGGGAGELENRRGVEGLEGGGERGRIERGMDGVAGEGVVVGERDQRGGRQATAGAAERDAGGGVAAEMGPGVGRDGRGGNV
jgi:hypothetical protein